MKARFATIVALLFILVCGPVCALAQQPPTPQSQPQAPQAQPQATQGQAPPSQDQPPTPQGQAPQTTAQQQAATPAGESALTNQDIVKLSGIGLGPDVIITKIVTAQQVAFKLETDDLIALKSAGVSQEVITAMLQRAAAPSQQSQPATLAEPTAQTPSSDVALRSKDGEITLVGRQGEMSAKPAFFTAMLFYDYRGAESKVLLDLRTTRRAAGPSSLSNLTQTRGRRNVP